MKNSVVWMNPETQHLPHDIVSEVPVPILNTETTTSFLRQLTLPFSS